MSRTIQIQINHPSGETKMIAQECSDSIATVIDAVHAVRTQTNSYLTHLIENINNSNVSCKESNDCDNDGMDDLDIEQVDGENKRKSTDLDDIESKRLRQ